MTVREHYDKHLGNFYSWMMGDYEECQQEFFDFLVENDVKPTSTKIAIDLGAGHGIQSLPLAKLSFNVISIDFNQQLLDELKNNAAGYNIKIKNGFQMREEGNRFLSSSFFNNYQSANGRRAASETLPSQKLFYLLPAKRVPDYLLFQP